MTPKDTIFMLAGPVKMHPRVLQAMTAPYVSHRGAEFTKVIGEIRDLSRYLFRTDKHVCVVSASGTAGLDAAISNLFRNGDKILNLDNGKFGERFHEVCEVYAGSSIIKSEWGKPFNLDAIGSALEGDEFKAVTICHNETSTGMTNQLEEIAKVAKDGGAMVIADVITSAGGLPFKPDEWGVDVAVVGSQKCLAAPAGLSIVYLSDEAYESLHEDVPYYLNLKKHVDRIEEDSQTPWTPAIPLFLALRESLLLLKEEGLENRLERVHRLAEAARAAIESLGLELFPDSEYASDTVTAIRYPPGIEDQMFRSTLREKHGVVVAGGQALIEGEIFRIGTMGFCTMTDLLCTFGAAESVLREMGVEVRKGSGTEVFADYL
ncbi:MAG: pyridoxal-phosphate-dependent aminotransferase family protein [Thermoplasmata archaeon]